MAEESQSKLGIVWDAVQDGAAITCQQMLLLIESECGVLVDAHGLKPVEIVPLQPRTGALQYWTAEE